MSTWLVAILLVVFAFNLGVLLLSVVVSEAEAQADRRIKNTAGEVAARSQARAQEIEAIGRVAPNGKRAA